MIDLENLTPEILLSLSQEEQETIFAYIDSLKDYVKYNQLEFCEPFPYQEVFMEAGSKYKTRFLRAGNRSGKTYGASIEFAYHLTGLYPDWWKGERVEGSGHVFWVIGITLNSVAQVIQKELLGTNDCRDKQRLGTGRLPKHTIITDRGWQPDGACLRQCLIKHKDGGENILAFWGSENESVMMGHKVRYVWMDEENPYTSLQIYSQCQTRLLNAAGKGKNGSMIITATPEGGKTPLNDLFERNEKKNLYLQQASMEDNPTLTEEQIEDFLSKIPVWQRAMRRNGLPVLGNQAVFPFLDDEITVDEITPLAHWEVMMGIDIGEKIDPSVIAICVYDPDNEKYYLYKTLKMDFDQETRSAKHVADVILNSEFSAVPLMTPHDAGVKSNDPNSYAKILQRMGVNVFPDSFQNPADTQLGIQHTGKGNKSNRKISTGLNEMILGLEDGSLKIKDTCFEWLKEKQNYYLKVNKNTGTVSYAGDDHHIDASRYAYMSLRRGLGCRWDQRNDSSLNQFQTFETIRFNGV
ncbi:terminase family protein [Escherichia coli]|nr:terminase family protein [Escherichia coli]